MAHILILTVSFPEVPFDSIEAKLDNALDWIRYAPGCWLIHTRHSAQVWYSQFFQLPELANSLIFLTKVDLEDHSGRMSPHAWEWIARIRGESAPIAAREEQTVGAV